MPFSKRTVCLVSSALLLATGVALATQGACYGRRNRNDVIGQLGQTCYNTCQTWQSCTGDRTWSGTTPQTTPLLILCDKKAVATQDQFGNIVCVGGSSTTDAVYVGQCPEGTTACPSNGGGPGDDTGGCPTCS